MRYFMLCTSCSVLHALYFSPSIIHVMKRTRMGMAEYLHLPSRREIHRGVWWGNLKERDHSEDIGVDGKIILKCIINKDGTA